MAEAAIETFLGNIATRLGTRDQFLHAINRERPITVNMMYQRSILELYQCFMDF